MLTILEQDHGIFSDGEVVGFIQDRTIRGAARRAVAGGADALAKALGTAKLPFGVSELTAGGRDWTIINTKRPRGAR